MNADLFFRSAGDERGTPRSLFDRLNAEFHFDLDAAARPENAKCDLYFGPGGVEEDALSADWGGPGTSVFLNPPYSACEAFIAKAREEADKGAQVVMVLPVRSDTKYWHKYILPFSGLEKPWFASTPDIAWAAGIIDGEGSIGIYANHPDVGDHLFYLRLTVNNSDHAMLVRLQAILRVGNIRRGTEATDTRLEMWCWEANSAEAAKALKYVYPYLVTKQQEAEIGLKFFHGSHTVDEKRCLADTLKGLKRVRPSEPAVGARVRFLPGRLEFTLSVPVELRTWIKSEYQTLFQGDVPPSDSVIADWFKSMVSVTGLPRMSLARILKDVPDSELLDAAPFPSCVVIFSQIR